jgi:hypothetical protein
MSIYQKSIMRRVVVAMPKARMRERRDWFPTAIIPAHGGIKSIAAGCAHYREIAPSRRLRRGRSVGSSFTSLGARSNSAAECLPVLDGQGKVQINPVDDDSVNALEPRIADIEEGMRQVATRTVERADLPPVGQVADRRRKSAMK